VLAAATALDDRELPAVLKAYASKGGHVVVSPFTAYMSNDGVFRGDGFGANLADITGAVVRTARRMGTQADAGREDQKVAWLDSVSPVGIDGYCEYLKPQAEAELFGRFQSSEPVLNGQPAAVRRKLGSGSAIKLGFWPKDDSLAKLFRSLVREGPSLLASPAAPGVQAVPRTDASLFVVNTSSKNTSIQLSRAATDRLSGRRVEGQVQLGGYAVLWLE
jgi:beta-galactosidase GanA